MKTLRPLRRIGILATACCSVLLIGCEEDRTAEFDQLNEDIANLRESLTSAERRHEDTKKKNRELLEELSEMRLELSRLKSDEAQARQELARFEDKEEERLAEEAEPDSEKSKAAAREKAGKNLAARVTISGENGSGMGILVDADDKTWIYFGTTLLEGATQLEIKDSDGGDLRKFGAFEVDGARGLARLEVAQDVPHKLVPAAGSLSTATRSIPLFSVNKSGELIEDKSYGTTKGNSLRPGRAIADSPSGALVLHGESGELVGIYHEVDTEEPQLWIDDYISSSRPTMEIALLDGSSKWAPAPIGAFLEEARIIAEMDRTTRLIHAFATVSLQGTILAYGSIPNSRTTAEEVFKEHAAHPSVRALKDLEDWLKEKAGRASESDIEKQVSRVFRGVEMTGSGQTRAFESKNFSPAHATRAAQSLAWRKDAEKALSQAAAQSD